jgi:hypothetical protein
MTSISHGGPLVVGEQFLPLQGNTPSTKFSESNRSTVPTESGSNGKAATIDEGEACFQGNRHVSIVHHEFSSIESVRENSLGVSSSERCRSSPVNDEMKMDKGQQTDHYDPFHYVQSTGVKQEDLDLDQLDAGGMLYDDSEDHQTDESRASNYERKAVPLSDDVEAYNANTPPSSLFANGLNETCYSGRGTKSVDICQPKNETHVSGDMTSSSVTFQTSGGTQTPPTHTASSTDGSVRPVLYSAIGSLENASATSFGKIRSHHKASSAREFDRPPGNLLPPVKKTGALAATLILPELPAQTAVGNPRGEGEQEKQETTPITKITANINTPLMPLEGSGWSEEVRFSRVEPDLGLPRRKSTGALWEADKVNQGLKEKRSSSRLRRKLKKVTIDESKRQVKEIFRPSSDAYTPRVEKKNFKFKPAEMRTPIQKSQNMGTLSRPNFRDALKRVAMIVKQHIVKIEQRFDGSRSSGASDGLFRASMMDAFSEDNFATPKYKCTMVRLPMARPGMVFGLRKVKTNYAIPTEEEIYEFGHQLFHSVQLSSECSIVCLIYMERLMEVAKVPLVARTWRTIFMCGLLLASKVWQDLSSWNIEFASVYPQYSLEAINRLEVQFLKMIKWDLYISSSLYAKYYFALRSILEKPDFRMRYNRMVGGVGSVDASEALKVQLRSELVKEEALLQFSRSM